MNWDVFISHASEDKNSFVRPLANALQTKGLKVWYDEFTLTVGDSLRRSIDYGLANSKYGIVVLSPNFFAKEWPQKELDGLFSREVSGMKIILPIWHNITTDQIRKYSPTLADRIGVNSERGLDSVVTELLRVIENPTGKEISKPLVASSPLRRLNLRRFKWWEIVSFIIAILSCIAAWLALPQIQSLFTGVNTSSAIPSSPILTLTSFYTPTQPILISPTPSPTVIHTPTETLVLSPTSTLVPTETSTKTPTKTPSPSFTPTSIPPTATPAPTIPIVCAIPSMDQFVSFWQDNKADLGCPTDAGTIVSPACEQAFQGGHLFWRSDTTQVYMVFDRDKSTDQELFEGDWFIGPREWGWDGSNPDGVGLIPPSGYYEPIGGLGWLWRQYLGREDGRLGWAIDKENCFDNLALAQTYQNGIMYKSSDPKIYSLLNNDKFIATR